MTDAERDAYEELAGIYENDGHPAPTAERMARDRVEGRKSNAMSGRFNERVSNNGIILPEG